MNLIDRILGRKADLVQEQPPEGPTRQDALAVQQYERMLRTAPTSTIEQVHIDAFEKLTPAQLDLLFDRFTAAAPSRTERPADAHPRSLARSAAQTEVRKPGTLRRILGGNPDNPGADAWMQSSLLYTIAEYSLASAIWVDWDAGSSGLGGWGDLGDWW
ncbi:hypothetical protein [Orlajensenia leifsoniae]|uniref:Uncharacterized protein n=1 Tax=Orlajensenia leifsoniae TaxID=2561933 RepID=A0A4Y9RAP0_9MICO|nr:hypothetical protein [Leifsonia flava]TFW00176.1 hypothetical protein E4M00_03030 [Leifsonia flava]